MERLLAIVYKSKWIRAKHLFFTFISIFVYVWTWIFETIMEW